MKLQKNVSLIHVLTAGMLVLVSLCIYAFSCGKKEACVKVQAIFENVIVQDCDKRLGLAGVIHKPLGRKVKHVEITVNDSIETIHLEDSLDESVVNQLMFQYSMLEDNPLHPDDFNALLKKGLEEHRISSEATGVVYRYNNQTQYSDNDSIGMQSAFVTEATYIDIKKLASVQAWVKSDFGYTVRNIPDGLKYGICGLAALLASAGIFAWMKKERSKRRILQTENEQRKAEITERVEYEKDLFGNTCRFEGMTLYERARSIHVDHISHMLPNKEFRLLWMFVTAPDHTLHGKDIQDAFWPDSLTASNNMHVLIKGLRTSLEKFPDYQLKAVKGKKFKLVFGEDNNDAVSADD